MSEHDDAEKLVKELSAIAEQLFPPLAGNV